MAGVADMMDVQAHESDEVNERNGMPQHDSQVTTLLGPCGNDETYDMVVAEDAADEITPTETIQQGLSDMKARKENTDCKIDDMIAVTVEFLDTLKEQFIARMNSMKSEMDAHCQQQTLIWVNMSAEANDLCHRLQSAQDLVQSFNCQAVLPIR